MYDILKTMKAHKRIRKRTQLSKYSPASIFTWKIIALVLALLVTGGGYALNKTSADRKTVDLHAIMSEPLPTNPKSRVAYSSNGKMYSVSLDGSDEKVMYEVADDTHNLLNAKASPDGSKIAVEIGNKLYLMDSDGSDLWQVTHEPVIQSVWAPQGNYLLYKWSQYLPAPDRFACVKGGEGCAERYGLVSTKSGKSQSVDLTPQDTLKYFYASNSDDMPPYIATPSDPSDGDDYDRSKSNSYFSRGFGPQKISLHNSETDIDTVLLTSNQQPYFMLVGVLPKQNIFVIKYNNKQSPIMSLEKRELDGSQPVTLASSDTIIRFVGGLD